MQADLSNKNLLGINGLGRIGKLTLWYHLQNRHFDGFVVNVGREVGKSLEDILFTITRDSTYGPLHRFLHGCSSSTSEIEIIDEATGTVRVDGLPLKILRKQRNPRDINWAAEDVRLVIDCTGKFLDPTLPSDNPKGSARGHLDAGAKKVIVSAPFKIKDAAQKTPIDSEMLVYGINHISYDPAKHHIISGASCTTTGLAHMIKPLIDTQETSEILTASMSTVHAATSTQSILDSVPTSGTGDLRKSRSVLNNIILSSTGAAKALENIIPEIKQIGFMADSVRIPTNTVSLITLNVTFHTHLTDTGQPVINHHLINDIYKKAAESSQKGLLRYSEKQNVSADLIGDQSAVVIEGHETHSRTGFMHLTTEMLERFGVKGIPEIQIPVTHAKIFGWYDNEFGSYVSCLGKLTEYVDKRMT